ncbi:MAG: hypothetical protein FJ303_01705 [Planctomycetes bacterium]|nr:hypothetical protein [Planctomycetota bacterium]
MGVGLLLTGTYASAENEPSADSWLQEVASWIEGHEEEPLMVCEAGVNCEEQPTLYVQIHPCAEDVEISVPEPGVCVVSAKTSTVGPGYHIFLCELLHAMSEELGVIWGLATNEDGGDETGYFYQRDASAVRHEMLRWLSAVAGIVTENCKKSSDIGVRMVSMPLYRSYPDQAGILTPLGPRSPEWFSHLVHHPEDGIEFFPWWPDAIGAEFFLGRALSRMWQDLRWRAPITEEEGELLMDIHFDLERALHLDPSVAIPWREWGEMLNYFNEFFGYVEFEHEDTSEEGIQHRAASDGARTTPIGYRRGRVEVTLTGGWSLTIPGTFAEQWEQNGETWSAWHGGRTIWFTSWSVTGEDDRTLNAGEILDTRPWPEERGGIIEYQAGLIHGRAIFAPHEENGQPMWNLKGYSAVEGNFCLCNIFVQNEADRDWAIETWKSLRCSEE